MALGGYERGRGRGCSKGAARVQVQARRGAAWGGVGRLGAAWGGAGRRGAAMGLGPSRVRTQRRGDSPHSPAATSAASTPAAIGPCTRPCHSAFFLKKTQQADAMVMLGGGWERVDRNDTPSFCVCFLLERNEDPERQLSGSLRFIAP